eukprot:CAMPEP_0118923600 /NCGR_PEP_ID=MMETSP1169-20130426/2064_1 /TAXON_ID=36882 /ORGANISM="Pyramimonas obovata, Strain CCMP722" /LENGTH=60 /DNA_ID=CAMNT_0006864613 /DNA_START=78 /DNA_END=257 /DNA_ORIENTATION=+
MSTTTEKLEKLVTKLVELAESEQHPMDFRLLEPLSKELLTTINAYLAELSSSGGAKMPRQ